MVVTLNVVTPRGAEITVDICMTSEELGSKTVNDLQKAIVNKIGIDCELKIVHQGETLEETYSLEHYQITHGSTVQTFLSLLGGIDWHIYSWKK